jgi:hypothetical protein
MAAPAAAPGNQPGWIDQARANLQYAFNQAGEKLGYGYRSTVLWGRNVFIWASDQHGKVFGRDGRLNNLPAATVNKIRLTVPDAFILLAGAFALITRPLFFVAGCAVGAAERYFGKGKSINQYIWEKAHKVVPFGKDNHGILHAFTGANGAGFSLQATHFVALLILLTPIAKQGAAFFTGYELARWGLQKVLPAEARGEGEDNFGVEMHDLGDNAGQPAQVVPDDE